MERTHVEGFEVKGGEVKREHGGGCGGEEAIVMKGRE